MEGAGAEKMKLLLIFTAVVVAACMVSGCMTPWDAKEETGKVLDNASDYLIPQITPIETLTFSPLVTSSSYVTQQQRTISPTLKPQVNDPIIGRWMLSPGTPYSCTASILETGTGSISCEYIYNRDIQWENIGQNQNQTWLNNYNITDSSSGDVYQAEYSSMTDKLYSEILPSGTYLTRVD